jgi:hypothetical protein
MSGIRAVVAMTTVMSEGTKHHATQRQCHAVFGPNYPGRAVPAVLELSFLLPFAQI